MNKPWYKSKTIWANALVIVSGLTAAIDQSAPILGNVDPRALFVIGAANIFLRAITNSGITAD